MMTLEEIARWNNHSRKPFRLFKSVGEELSVGNAFWRNRTPHERLEYLEFMRCVIYGEEVVNAPMVRCFGRRKWDEEECDPKNIVYF